MSMGEDYDYDINEDERKSMRNSQNKEPATSKRRVPRKNPGWKLPTKARVPVIDPWRYAYLLTGEKKIGKTSWAIAGCKEYVIQLDKPQLSYEIVEDCPTTWKELVQILRALEESAADGTFPYQRVIVDGIGEAYVMCQDYTVKEFGVAHPSEVGYAKAWHFLRDNFLDWMNRLLRLQQTAKCGVVFIAHAEWREVTAHGGGKIDKLVPNLAGKCEEIVNGKVDAWFMYDYIGSDRVMFLRGNEEIGAGHRIDGRFLTPEGERISELYMGNSAKEGLDNFLLAFKNQWPYATYNAWKDANTEKPKKTVRRSARRSAKK